MNKMITSLIPIFVFFVFCNNALAAEKVLDIQAVESATGIHAWLVEDHSVPVIAIQFSFKNAGAKNDPINKQGLAQLASNTMDEGAGEIESLAFQKLLQDNSISLRFTSSRDHFGGQLKTLTRNKDKAFDLLKLALIQPRFDPEPLERMRASNKSRIKSSITDPTWMNARIENDRIFEGHPYALNSGGTLSSLDNITTEDLHNFHKKLGKNQLIIGVAGDISAEELKSVLDNIFSILPDVNSKDFEKFELKNVGKTYLYKQDIPQTVIRISQKGVNRKDDDYHAAKVMNFILGESGFGSRLMEEIREKRGLTYGIFSYFKEYEETDVLHVVTSTVNPSVLEMLSLIHEEWDKIKKEPVSEIELKNAKSYLIGSLPLSFTSTDSIAAILLSMQLDDLPIDYLDQRKNKIQHVTAEQIQNAAKRVLDKNKFTTILVGNPDGIEDAEIVETLPNVE